MLSGPIRQTRAPWLKLLLGRDQLALINHDKGGRVRTFLEELRRREDEHAVMLGDEEEVVVRHADAVRHLEVDRRRELLDDVGNAVLVLVDHRVDLGLARADEEDAGLTADRHVPGVRHHGVKADLEARRQLDLLQVLLDLVGAAARLGNLRDGQIVRRRLEGGELFQVSGAGRLGERPGREAGRRDCGHNHVFSEHAILPTLFLHSG